MQRTVLHPLAADSLMASIEAGTASAPFTLGGIALAVEFRLGALGFLARAAAAPICRFASEIGPGRLLRRVATLAGVHGLRGTRGIRSFLVMALVLSGSLVAWAEEGGLLSESGSKRGASPTLRSPTASEGQITPSGKFVPSTPAFVEKRAFASKVPLTNLMGLIPDLLKVEGKGKYRLGLVSLDSKSRSLSFPAKLNMESGLLEYGIVSSGGKVHESLLVSAVQPLHVHLGALLLGLASTNSGAVVPVRVAVEWRGNGPTKTVALEEMIALREGSPQGPQLGVMPKSLWNYTGSMVIQGRFEADAEGSIISLIGDPVALASCPYEADTKGGKGAQVFVPNTFQLPPAGLPLTVKISPAEAD